MKRLNAESEKIILVQRRFVNQEIENYTVYTDLTLPDEKRHADYALLKAEDGLRGADEKKASETKAFRLRRDGHALFQTVDLLLQIGQKASCVCAVHLCVMELKGDGQKIPEQPFFVPAPD